jgi:hypothetical protein
MLHTVDNYKVKLNILTFLDQLSCIVKEVHEQSTIIELKNKISLIKVFDPIQFLTIYTNFQVDCFDSFSYKINQMILNYKLHSIKDNNIKYFAMFFHLLGHIYIKDKSNFEFIFSALLDSIYLSSKDSNCKYLNDTLFIVNIVKFKYR